MLSSFFASCEEIDFDGVVLVGQLGLTAARSASTATVSPVKQIIFSQFSFYLFLSQEV